MTPDEERAARACLALFGEWRELFSRVGALGAVSDADQARSNSLLLNAIIHYDEYRQAGKRPAPAVEIH